MTLEEFTNFWLGKKCDFDGFYGGQCVDLYRQYVKDVLGFPQSPGVGGAAEIWESASPEYYDFIPNTPEGVPLKGDIVIWNRRVGGGFGHVAIFIEGGMNQFLSFDQNWPTLDKCTFTEHSYSNVLGWLHPKENMDPLQECLAQHTKLVDEATELRKQIETLKSDKAAILIDIENMKRDHEVEMKQLQAEFEKVTDMEDLLQKERDGRRLDNLEWEMRKTEWVGEIEKIKLQINSEDLSLRDYRDLLRALCKKISRDIRSLNR